MPRRIALRLAVDGERFHGTQRQPEHPTANGALLAALDGAGLLADEHALRAAGRLDAGAHARDHVVAVNAHGEPGQAARTVAGQTTGLVPWAGATVHEGFDPRVAARSRTYRYLVPRVGEHDAARIADAWARFEGEHTFAEFARLDPDRGPSPRRRVTDARAWRLGDGLVLEATAPTFLTHQVRRMVGACRTVARGELAAERIDAALAGGELGTYEVAPAGGLVLHRVAVTADWAPLAEAERVGRERLSAARDRAAQRVYALDAVAEPRDEGPTRRPRA